MIGGRILDDRKFIIAIFLDLSKAFDTIDHELFLLKLGYYGFSQGAILIIKSYLSNRFCITIFDGARSRPEALKVGVPQESVMGPLFFIVVFFFYFCLTYVGGNRTLCIIKLNLL